MSDNTKAIDIRGVIIDDNEFIIEVLLDLLSEEHSNISILGTANNGEDGVALIHDKSPDLVFLDVEMPDMTGFQMLSKLNKIAFQTIFITSHSHYAIKAIRFNALDYLVKPIIPAELAAAIDRFLENQNSPQNPEGIQLALNNFRNDQPQEQILSLPTNEGVIRIPLNTIIKIEGDRNYSFLHTTTKGKILASKTLRYFEEILSGSEFLRCHRSTILNKKHVLSMKSSDTFTLNTNEEIQISRRRKKEARQWFESS